MFEYEIFLVLIFTLTATITASAILDGKNAESETTCTYTFNVPSDGASCMPSDQSGASIDALQSVLTNQYALLKHQLNVISDQLLLISGHGNNASGGNGNNQSNSSDSGIVGGTVYTNWGKTSCPSTAELLYEGYTAKSHYTHGGGVNYMCLPRDPEHPVGAVAGHQSQSYIYGTEYQQHNSPLMDLSLNDDDVPCAVCEVNGRTRQLMIPGKQSCPTSWTKEYHGLVMTDHHTHKGSEFICVNQDFETVSGGSPNENGGLLYVVETVCGSLPCPPYIDGFELGCVICTK